MHTVQNRFLLQRLVFGNAIASMTLGQNLFKRCLFLVRWLRYRLFVLVFSPWSHKAGYVGRIVVFLLLSHLFRFGRFKNGFPICVVGRLKVANKIRRRIGHVTVVDGRIQCKAVRMECASLILKVKRGNVRFFHVTGEGVFRCSHLFGQKWIVGSLDGRKEFIILWIVHDLFGGWVDGTGHSTGTLFDGAARK